MELFTDLGLGFATALQGNRVKECVTTA